MPSLLDHAGIEAGDRHGALERALLAALAGHDDLFDVPGLVGGCRLWLSCLGRIAFVGRMGGQSEQYERHSE